jgi:hypothetical protein
MVPRGVFEEKQHREGAPVMVWIHGGGYGAGTKYDTPPAGLVSRSQTGGREGVIYVALNYRLYVAPSYPFSFIDISQWRTRLAFRSILCHRRHAQRWSLRPTPCSKLGPRKHTSLRRRSRMRHCLWRIGWWRFYCPSAHCIWWRARGRAVPAGDLGEPWIRSDDGELRTRGELPRVSAAIECQELGGGEGLVD